MSDDMKRHTGRLLTTAVSLQQYQKRIDAMVNHAMGVVSILNEALEHHLPNQDQYGVDDNIEVDSTERRYGWRIYAARPGVGEFSGFTGTPPEVTERQTLLVVERSSTRTTGPSATWSIRAASAPSTRPACSAGSRSRRSSRVTRAVCRWTTTR
ncbi:MAG: hypothetical protein HND48_18655 [Chloroflexi bacterium]|nr:hypothetical protein [Chloroflexota bacterium]